MTYKAPGLNKGRVNRNSRAYRARKAVTPKPCPHCHGVPVIIKMNPLRQNVCSGCNGTGIASVRPAAKLLRARRIGGAS